MDPRKALKDLLADWKSWGVDAVPRGPEPVRPAASAPPAPARPEQPPAAAAPAAAAISAAGCATLDELQALVAGCTKCTLCRTRTRTVFCSGNPSPLMFVGEAPGADEDAQGEVFVGAAGKLLTRVLADLGLTRDRVYIANTLKCRPPNNRPPEPGELAACAPFLKRQIDLVNPRVLCALGKFAAMALLGWEGPMKGIRGTWRLVEGRWATATYHPSYLLRNPADTGLVKADLLGVLEKLKGLGVRL